MKSEQAAFGERFRAALKAQGQSESPKEIADLLPRYGGTPVSAQAVSGWLTGKYTAADPRRSEPCEIASVRLSTPPLIAMASGEWHVRTSINRVSAAVGESFMTILQIWTWHAGGR